MSDLIHDAKTLLIRLAIFKKYTLNTQKFTVEEIAIDTVILLDKSGNVINIEIDKIAEYLDRFDNGWDCGYNTEGYNLEDYITHLHESNQLADIAACADFWHLEAESINEARNFARYQEARHSIRHQQPEQQSDYLEPIEIR